MIRPKPFKTVSMSYHPFFTFLTDRLQKPLPGWDAQLKMCPLPVNGQRKRHSTEHSGGSPNSVLIPLYPDSKQDLNVILTLRTESIRHAGQISFPGGRAEVNETPKETALRETKEEIGIKPATIRLAGQISPLYLFKSDNKITPYVGFLDHKPTLTRNPNEVEEIITVKLNTLLSDTHLKRETWTLQERELEVPYWNIHRVPLWGATAMILSELLEIYKGFLQADS